MEYDIIIEQKHGGIFTHFETENTEFKAGFAEKIDKLYENCPVQPTIDISSNAFKITLPNMNEASVSSLQTECKSTQNEQMQNILAAIRQNGSVTDAEVESLLGVKKTRAFNVVKEMRDLGLITVRGRGKDKVYVLK